MPRAPQNLDMDLLRAFAAVAEAGSVTAAGERLGRTQSTVSLQLKRLEDVLGRRLLHRGPRGVRPTDEGEAVLAQARRILALNDALLAHVAEPPLEGTVRLGAPEDFATAHLPGVLQRFAAAHPRVALEVTCDLTLNLLEGFARDAFDIVLVKQEPSGPAGQPGTRVWREALVWGAAHAGVAEHAGPLPLVVSPDPCVYRRRAMAALERAGRPWRVAYTSTSLAGAQAAVRAGLGIGVLPRGSAPSDLVLLGAEAGLPPLEDAEIALCAAPNLSVPARRLAEHITRSLEAAHD
jgi:DNA-binding transcriptional LysR family regulator